MVSLRRAKVPDVAPYMRIDLWPARPTDLMQTENGGRCWAVGILDIVQDAQVCTMYETGWAEPLIGLYSTAECANSFNFARFSC